MAKRKVNATLKSQITFLMFLLTVDHYFEIKLKNGKNIDLNNFIINKKKGAVYNA